MHTYEKIATNRQPQISKLTTLAVRKQQQLLVEWNDTQIESYQNVCIHQLFEAQVEKTPDAVAVVLENQQLTYRQLNQQANQLAHHLLTLSVGPEVLVGICLERSLEMVVGILAILKAGGAYLPLDPAYPPERLAFMMADSQTPVLLTQQQFVASLPTHHAQVLCLDSDWQMIAQNSQHNPICAATSDNLAYVIYTSGSTGQPKGVMIPHSGICNLLFWRQTTFHLTAQDKVLQTISFSFDPSVWQIFWPLSFGGQLIMARPGGQQDTAYLVKTITEMQITMIALVPSILRVLLQQEGIDNCQCLRHICCGGEALSTEIVERFFAQVNKENVLLNCYGPTEASIDVTFFRCQRGNNNTTAPIGCPITNVQTYILDEKLQPVAIGEAGELHIGGVGLARGYLNRPDLTAQKFIPNPFDNCEFTIQDSRFHRLYKTGDLACYLPNGEIQFLGRIDDQVKIRGFRIELGEIEAVLAQHPAIEQTLVIAIEDVPGNKRLVAYIVAKSQQAPPTQSELRQFLQTQLPEYMLPGAFVLLEELPLNQNGKVNRHLLPKPDISSFNRSTQFVAPSTPTEQVLATIWAEVLGLKNLSINDNFFELGGNSLCAMQVISRVRHTFGIEIPLQLLFETSTIAALASKISSKKIGNQEHHTIPKLINRDSAMLSFAQQRLWLLAHLEPDSAVYNIVDAFQLQGLLNVEVLQQSLDAIVAHHEALRTNFILSANSIPIQVIGVPRSVELTLIDLTHNQHQDIHSILNQQAQRPFNLASDLMLRATVLQINPQKHVLLLVMHHIASDGWSMGILWQQLASVYQAFLNNKPHPLPKLPIQYADFAVWQRQCLSGEVLNNKLEYWKTQLKGANHVLELRTDQPRPPMQTYRGAVQSLLLPQTLAASLTALSQQEGVTLFMTLLAVFGTLLHRYTGQEDISIGSPFAGRDRLETEQLIGFFINTVVLRLDFSSEPSFRSLLTRVREVVLGAYTHQDMPFEKLVEELQPERDTSRNPLFQVWFNMLNLGDIQLELPSLSCEPVEMTERTSMFDLNLYVIEQKHSIQLKLVYNSDLFASEQMSQMLEQFNHLLNQIVDNPAISIADLSLVTPLAQSLLPNPQQPLTPQSQPAVHTIFSQQAQKVPQQLAVVDTQVRWTYAELEERANQLANYLLANQIQSQNIVAIYGHRSAALIVSMLGVLKAGAAFVILDPAYPTSRLIDCLKLVKPRGWLKISTNKELPKEIQEYVDCSIQCRLQFSSGSIHNVLQDYATSDPQVSLQSDHLAYVAFTSGSTGKPKGIKGTHSPVSHFLQWHSKTFSLNQTDKFSLLSGLSHDPLLRDIFTPLSLGATLYIPEQKDIETFGRLADWMQQKQISVAHLTPAMAQLLTTDTTVISKDLRYVFFAGDVLTQQQVSKIYNFAPLCTCVNYYGTTETPQAMGYLIIPRNSESEQRNYQQKIPLGRGIEDVQLLVLTSKLQLAGIGEVGEICVRTPYLTSGYLDSDSTQERFIINPLTKIPCDQLYKTGDKGCYLSDGNIEFLGRSDRQVKIRGFRIELGEIEATLAQHPTVKESVAIAHEDITGSKQLVAYVQLRSKPVSIVEQLRHFLQEKLPKYMIPTAFIILESIPLTPNGKVDLLALPVPEQLTSQAKQTFVAPRDHLESKLVQIWEKVLGIQPIGIRDNFFDLGGHSLLAIELFAQIQSQFSNKLPISTLFKAGTVEDLAQLLRKKQEKKVMYNQEHSETSWSSLVEIQPNGSKPPLFCLPGVGGEVLRYHNLAQHLGSEQPVYGLQPPGLDGIQPLCTRVEDMASLYIQEIQTIQPHGPYYFAGYSFGGVVAFEMAQQLQKLGHKVGVLALLDTCVPNSYTRLPFSQRLPLHLHNLLQQGPAYLRHKLVNLSNYGKYNLQQQYMRFLGIKKPLPEEDKHLDIVEASLLATRKYKFQVYSGPIVLLRTDDKTRTDVVGEQYDPQFGWGSLVSARIEVHFIPGSHYTFLFEPNVQIVAEKLKDCLERACAGG